MKGSVFVLLGCLALFFAAPSRSSSVPEGERLASRRDTRSGSPSTDAGESKTMETDADTKRTDESVAGDAPAEKFKRDTSSVLGDDDLDVTTMPPIDKEYALDLFKQLGKHGGQCIEKAFYYIQAFEMPVGSVEPRYPQALFTRSDMVKWLKILTSSVSECLMTYAYQLDTENVWLGGAVRDSVRSSPDTFADVPALMSPLLEIGRTMKWCVEDAIRYMAAQGRGDTVQRSSEFPDPIGILPLIEGRAAPAGDTVFPPGHPYSVHVNPAYKKRNSPDKPRGYRHYNPPRYVYNKNIPVSRARQFSGSAAAAVQIPYPPGVPALPTQQVSLLNMVLGQIYSKLQEKAPSASNAAAWRASGSSQADGAVGFYPGSEESPAAGNHGLNPECVRKRGAAKNGRTRFSNPAASLNHGRRSRNFVNF